MTGALDERIRAAGLPARDEHDSNRRGTWVVVALIAAAFGPYVLGSLRTEQLAVYAAAAIAVVTAPTTYGHSLRGLAAARLLATWVTFVLVAAATSLGVPTVTLWPSGSLLSGLDNLLMPVAVMIAVWLLVRPEHAQRLLLLASRLIALALAANGALSIVMTQVDLTGPLRRFWAAGTKDVTGDFAAQLGRYSGVFNQPAEAGLAYGLAAVCCWYVWHDRPRVMYALLVPIVAGGFICVSKVFILGGLPILLWLIWRSRGSSSKLGLLFALAGATVAITQTSLTDRWIGFGFLKRLINPDEDVLLFYTANRVGSGSTLTQVIAEVLRVDPLFGFGARGLLVAYDNAWVEAMVMAGLIGAACYTLTLVWLWLAARADPDAHRRRMFSALVLLAAGGSVGVSALTANRAGSLLWLVLALVVAAGTHQWSENRSEQTSAGATD